LLFSPLHTGHAGTWGRLSRLSGKQNSRAKTWSPTADEPGIVQYTHVFPLNFLLIE
jgi:hypothetical protein